MSAEETPSPTANGSGAPVRLSFGAGKGLSLPKKKAPLVNKTAAAAFGHQEDKVEKQKDELIAGLDGNKIERYVLADQYAGSLGRSTSVSACFGTFANTDSLSDICPQYEVWNQQKRRNR